MVDVFDEVEEELRRERYQALLRQWGPWVGGAAAAIVIGVAGYQFLDWRSVSMASQASDLYMTGAERLAAGNPDLAVADFETLSQSGPRGYQALALMRQAEIAITRGDADEAARLYSAAAERSPEPLLRDLARYKAALTQFDSLSYDDLVARMEPLTEGDAPFGVLARELMAAGAVKAERWDEARRRYELLTVALDAPPGVALRTAEALAFIARNAPEAEPSADAAAGVSPEPAPAAEPAAEGVLESDSAPVSEDGR